MSQNRKTDDFSLLFGLHTARAAFVQPSTDPSDHGSKSRPLFLSLFLHRNERASLSMRPTHSWLRMSGCLQTHPCTLTSCSGPHVFILFLANSSSSGAQSGGWIRIFLYFCLLLLFPLYTYASCIYICFLYPLYPYIRKGPVRNAPGSGLFSGLFASRKVSD